ncbi:hypothetical protein cypCar_00012609 [Cyprinus carpio]|nr:hypothetical protein cypCar_00012609 [Cyprinus carpio]
MIFFSTRTALPEAPPEPELFTVEVSTCWLLTELLLPSDDGQLFVWGDNSHGQLGLEKDHPGSPSAQHVQSLSGIPLAQISAGGDHSFGHVTWDETEVELDPAEPGKMVTNYNRTEFVDKYVDYILNKSVEEAFEEFKRGFFKACDRCMVEMFEPEELRGVLVGNEEYDWDILKQNTTYEGSFYAEHPTIISFWEVFEELTPNEKKAFLLFLTGFEKVPILRMSAVKMRVTLLLYSTQDHLPQALTCYSLLALPVYQNKETLKAKLIEAINHKRGFWEE